MIKKKDAIELLEGEIKSIAFAATAGSVSKLDDVVKLVTEQGKLNGLIAAIDIIENMKGMDNG